MKSSVRREDNRAASDVFPPPPKVNSLQAITRLRPVRGSQWCTFAFVLNRDMIKHDGSLDELHAMVFPLGAFDDQSKAEEHAKNVISITGHPGVIAAQYGSAVPLTTKFDPKAVTEVAVDPKGRLIELESAQYRREREEHERQAKQEREIMKEAEDETDIDNIEHFKRQCFVAIKNRSSFQVHSREAETAWQNYKKREMAVRDHFARHPEHEKEWLPYLKEKLAERGEINLYFGIEAAYQEIRDELLGLIDDESTESDTITTLVNPVTIPTVDSVTAPTVDPVTAPTVNPVTAPTVNPVTIPTVNPVAIPTVNPVTIPTVNPVNVPAILHVPTLNPVTIPTVNPVNVPTILPVATVNPVTIPIVNPITVPIVNPITVPIANHVTIPIVNPTVPIANTNSVSIPPVNVVNPGIIRQNASVDDKPIKVGKRDVHLTTSSSDEDCSGGICMATPVKERLEKSDDDDEIIAAEDVPIAYVSNSPISDPGFVEEIDDN